ncbi:MAG: hypothetical protein WKF35_03565 [Ferruginibacter sp.]
MSDCNFTIPFSGPSDIILNKARTAVESQGGVFNGDENLGNFQVSVFGNSISGSYLVSGENLNIIIDSKPFLVPCSAIQSFLTKLIN